MKLLIFGASGSGTTTLGQELAQQLNWVHLDADDYYWKKTDPPFQTKVPLEVRNSKLTGDFEDNDPVIISGSLVSWGPYWETVFDIAIFLYLPNHIRMARLKEREHERYGGLENMSQSAIEGSRAFLDWANEYDNEQFNGRSLAQHRLWMEKLSCPIISIMGDTSTEERVNRVIEAVKLSKQPQKTIRKKTSKN